MLTDGDEATQRFWDELSNLDEGDARRRVAEMNGPGPAMVRVNNISIPGAMSPTQARVLTPIAQPSSIIIYLTDSLSLVSSMDQFDTVGRKLAERTGCVVVVIEPQSATEYGYCVGVQNSFIAARWVSEHVMDLVGRSVPIIMAGEGVGGSLAAATSMKARGAPQPVLAAQVLICPILEFTAHHPWLGAVGGVPRPFEASARRMFASVRQELDGQKKVTEPMRAAHYAGLPPTIILSAGQDPLSLDAERYARELEQSNVVVTHTTYQAQRHGFFSLLALPASERGFQQVVRAIRSVVVYSRAHPDVEVRSWQGAGDGLLSTNAREAQ